MTYRIVITKEAYKDIAKLDRTIQLQLQKKLTYVATLRDIKSIAKKLHDHHAGDYRIRIGNYRMVFDLERSTIILLRIQHRKEVYR